MMILGYLLTLNAIITWGLASIVYKASLEKTDVKASLLFRLVCVSIATFIFALIFGDFFSVLSTKDLMGYLIACFISGLTVTIGDLIYFSSLKKIDASRAFPLTQLSLIFIYPFAFFLFGEKITLNVLIGGSLILSSVFLLSYKDKDINQDELIYNENSKEGETENSEDVFIGVMLAIGAAFCWALAMVAFNQARIITGDVFVTNFIRISFATIFISILGIFKREYYAGFKKKNRDVLKYHIYIGIAGSLSLGLADSFFYKAAEINGLVLTSTITANTPMVQQIFSNLILKEKFRKRFLLAIFLIILGNYIILFLQ
ncbi:MAG: DMT family transporter [Promethearchaeota archaeon]